MTVSLAFDFMRSLSALTQRWRLSPTNFQPVVRLSLGHSGKVTPAGMTISPSQQKLLYIPNFLLTSPLRGIWPSSSKSFCTRSEVDPQWTDKFVPLSFLLSLVLAAAGIIPTYETVHKSRNRKEEAPDFWLLPFNANAFAR
jgi:hypothetical protein